MRRAFEIDSAVDLKGRTSPWGRAAMLALAALVTVGLLLRLKDLAAEGFADDEIHKWLAAQRYLHGQFLGDDIEHPMLMKSLIAITLAIGGPRGWAPEFITRLPNVLASGVTIAVIALLGRRLFGRAAGLWAAGLAAVSPTLVGYQRVAKEDTLVTLFLLLVLWCTAEAKAAADDARPRDSRRWELYSAASVGAMMASKYFLFFAPIPVFIYLWLRPTGTAWRISLPRWLALVGVSLLVFGALNFTPLSPTSWGFYLDYFAEKKTISGSLPFMGTIYHNLPWFWFKGTPPWFYLVFTAVKLTPPTVLAAACGLGLALYWRRPSHRVVLAWMAVWFGVLSSSGSKWGRFYLSIEPAFLLLAGHATAEALAWFSSRRERPSLSVRRWQVTAAATFAALALWGTELQASLAHAPHYRLYISPLGGGDRNVGWFFPHCDYFDAGFREALAYVAARAEPNAEITTDIDWPARYYAERFGRRDLTISLDRKDHACRSGHVCYVVIQSGRLYFFNQDAVANLARRTPWHVERIRGLDVVRVYRLGPGESPFPADSHPPESALTD